MIAFHVCFVLVVTYVESCAGDRAFVIRGSRLGGALGNLRLLSPCGPSFTFREEICREVVAVWMLAT